jgi:predicted GIY-YIG superfamily endonuclease
MAQEGVVYLIHLSRAYRHARHYLGWTQNLEHRLAEHRAGRGSPLLAAAVADGIELELAATWPGDRHAERRKHEMKNSPARLCPICKAQRANRVADAVRTGEGGQDRAEELVLATLREQRDPVTLPVLAAALRERGAARPVGSLHGRLELLARQGRARKAWVQGEIAWGTVSDR